MYRGKQAAMVYLADGSKHLVVQGKLYPETTRVVQERPELFDEVDDNLEPVTKPAAKPKAKK